ncbi:MAG: Sua5/YciO/YrdC/YwlC family protein [Ilumatobacteraceae bacterium]
MSAPVLAGWTWACRSPPGPHTVRIAAEALAAGGWSPCPPRPCTAWAADASSGEGGGRIFTAKGRPADHPLIVHLADRALFAAQWVAQITDEAALLSDAWWPGPLTLVLPRSERVPRRRHRRPGHRGVRSPTIP